MTASLVEDIRVIRSLLRGGRGASHAERLDDFYGPQAAAYDRFRERLLKGRDVLLERLEPRAGAYWVELGGGTGRNLEFLGERLHQLRGIELVDLCEPLLEQAAARCRPWPNVRVIKADVTEWSPSEPADVVYFSYALSMMPRWREAIDNARAALAPGGRVGVVDFFVSSAEPAPGRVRHGWAARRFWPRWFAHDGVRLSPELPDRLTNEFPGGTLTEHTARVPWFGGLRVPYFVFVSTG